MAVISSYNKPDVTIIQEIVTPAQALNEPSLYACIVGPCYQIVQEEDAGTYDGTSELFEYPSLLDEAVVDQSSVVVKAIKDDYTDTLSSGVYTTGVSGVTLQPDITIERVIEDAYGVAGDVTAAGSILTDADASFISWSIVAGDILTILGSGVNAGDYTVSSVTSETEITVDGTFEATQQNVDYQMTKVDHIGDGVGALILLSYRALRHDLTDVGTIESTQDASSQLGVLVPENPLGYGISKALENATTMIKYVAILGDTIEQHTEAAEKLSTEEVYAIAPLTQNTSIISMWKAHVVTLSAPEEKMERIVICNRNLPLRQVRSSVLSVIVSADGTTGMYFVDCPGATFQGDGVRNGDIVYFATVTEISSVDATDGFTVRSIPSESRIVVESATDIVDTYAAASVCSKEHTRLEQAKHIRDYASSLEERRVSLVWPDQIKVTSGETQQTVPGYYLCAAIAGAISASPAQQGFTGFGFAGIDQLIHSNLGYFTQSQLNTMASGGVMIAIQDAYGAEPTIRHQLTTDMSIIENRELSLVKNPDYIAKYIRNTIRPVVGKYNITKFFLDMLRVTLESIFEALKEPVDSVGPSIISADVVSMEQNESQPDRVDIIVDLVIPFPANDIRITIRI